MSWRLDLKLRCVISGDSRQHDSRECSALDNSRDEGCTVNPRGLAVERKLREAADRKTIQQHITLLGGAEIMVPKEILHIKQIPVLGTGKLDYPAIQKLANKE